MRNLQAGKFNCFLMGVLAGFQKSKFPHAKTSAISNPVNIV
jgi:hypothetical protein